MMRSRLACTLISGLAFLALIVGLCPRTQAVPSFSRQTGLKCSVCHSNPPELTAFGRKFKLEGYTLTDKKTDTTIQGKALRISREFPISAMILLSETATNTTVPGTQNGTAGFPQQLSLFLAGEMSPYLGGMVQVTYDHSSDHITLDNTDVRYAKHTTLGSKDLLYGLTVNNSPTVEDVWNSTPSWGIRGCPPRALLHPAPSHSSPEGWHRMLPGSAPTPCGMSTCIRTSLCIAPSMPGVRSL